GRSYLPAGAVTGVGSLPIAEPGQAVAFVAAHAPEVPFWPQLPLRHAGEGMLRQTIGDPGPLIVAEGSRIRVAAGRVAELIAWLDDAPVAIGVHEAAGFQAFVRALRRGLLPAAKAVKGQLTGPLTLAAYLDHDGRPASQHPDLAAALVRRVAARAAWQARRLADHGLPTLVVVDEPVLGAMGPTLVDDASDALRRVLQAIRDNGAIAGLHTCATGRVPLRSGPDQAAGAGHAPPLWQPDLWSVDVHGRDGLLPQPVGEGWADGGLLAAGLVPTVSVPSALPAPADLVGAWLAAAAPIGDVEALADRTLVTATCGLAGVSLEAAEASFAHATETARHIRRLAGTLGVAGGALHRRQALPPPTATRARTDRS
ncbi:MAG TPA: hypothetical protein VMM13_15655, partial [Euzebya sp.]|nr:hypothetical protein [Euzebya sp.]